jgi:glycosyltransferase involved in cell wall biosynthesis
MEAELTRAGVEVYKSRPSGRLDHDVQATLDFLDEWQPEVFLPQCKAHHYVAAAIAGREGLPWILTLHSDDPDYWAVVESLPPQSSSGMVVCVSRSILSDLDSRFGQQDAEMIPYGVSIPAVPARYESCPFRVVYSGRLWEHQKRISLVLESLIKACSMADVDISATIIGDGYSRSSCESQAIEAGLGDRLTFTGRQPVASVREILQKSQAIILMSDFEGLPVALLEGMAAGLVPVARIISSGVPELVEHGRTGLLVSDSPDEAAAALALLAKDPALWKTCSDQARELVSTVYSDDISNGKWLNLLRQLQKRCSISYPIKDRRSVNLARLSPVIKASYRKARPFQFVRFHDRYATAKAQLKGWLKHVLGRAS